MAQPLRFEPNATVAATAPRAPRAAATAASLLWLGTAPFPLAAAALAFAPPATLGVAGRSALLSCLTSYGAMILAYIGGIQQATALHADNRAHEAWPLVVAGIGVRQQLRPKVPSITAVSVCGSALSSSCCDCVGRAAWLAAGRAGAASRCWG